MVRLRRRAPLLFGALLAIGCQDPPSTGDLIVTVSGLPAGAEASVRIMGPNQFVQQVRSTTTLESLAPGDYIVLRDSVVFSNTRFGVDSASVRDTISIVRGQTKNADASYGIASGSINLTISGLPGTVPATLRVTGPAGALAPFDQVIVSSTLLTGLRPGTYTLRADEMTSFFGDRFVGAPAIQDVTVPASMTPVDAAVAYAATSGTIALSVTGLDLTAGGAPISVTGPGGFTMNLAGTTTIRGLSAGTYTITSANVNGTCPNIFTASQTPFPDVKTVQVAVGVTQDASVAYTTRVAPPEWLNFRVVAFHFTQATQNMAGTVPLLSNRAALARVFVAANQCNTAKPKVRLTMSGAAPVIINATEDSVRLAIDPNNLNSSWHVVVPAGVMQPNMTVVVEVDPNNEFAEADEADNRFPAGSGVHTPDVRVAPVVGLRLVPITQTVSGSPLTGDITAANLDAFMDFSRRLHPATYNVDIREPYTTTTAALQAGGNNWVQVLEEISALRQVEASNRYYYGIAKVNYSSGVAGVAYVGGKTGIGWDNLVNAASRVMAHELGHNYNRLHSPCGNPAGIDQSYPATASYLGGKIGVSGWDPVDGIKVADQFTDVMGYCNVQWISDYTYLGMLNWLTNAPPSLPLVAGAEQPSLLVWGRIENGQPVLEPAFEISAQPALPNGGPHRLSALDSAGTELFGVSFSGHRVADAPGNAETFAFTIPVSALRGRPVASLRLTARGKTVSSRASSDVAADPVATVTRAGPRLVRVRWDAARFPVVMVRDPVRGHVLSFARGGDVTIATPHAELDLNFSNRLRSSRRLTQLR